MKPYYQDDAVTIYCGDCREILPTLSGDLVLTDPPYGVGLGAKCRPKKMRRHAVTYSGAFDDSRDYIESLVVDVITDAVDRFPRVVVTPGIRSLFLYPEPKTVWCGYWPNGAGMGRWMAFNCWTPILCYGDGPKRIGSIPDTIVTTESAEPNGHPCPKPYVFWKTLLSRVSDDSTGIILDPFMGSGTTLRAAKDLGRKAIGIEIEERYCEIAAKRMAQEVLF